MAVMRSIFAVFAALVWASATAWASDGGRLADFRHDMADDIAKASDYLDQTRKGENLSEFTLGWFVVGVLGDLGKQDAEMAEYLHRDGRFVESYLINVFQYNAAHEVAAFDAMAAKGHRNLRLAAREALEVLRHIPDTDDDPQAQGKDRAELALALSRLRDRMSAATTEVATQ